MFIFYTSDDKYCKSDGLKQQSLCSQFGGQNFKVSNWKDCFLLEVQRESCDLHLRLRGAELTLTSCLAILVQSLPLSSSGCPFLRWEERGAFVSCVVKWVRRNFSCGFQIAENISSFLWPLGLSVFIAILECHFLGGHSHVTGAQWLDVHMTFLHGVFIHMYSVLPTYVCINTYMHTPAHTHCCLLAF